jgi:hypothetical protein
MCCVEDGLRAAPTAEHERITANAAAALISAAEPNFGVGDPTDEARLRARKRLDDLARIAEQSLPRLAARFRNLASEPLPPSDDDMVWNAVRADLYGDFTLLDP